MFCTHCYVNFKLVNIFRYFDFPYVDTVYKLYDDKVSIMNRYNF